MSNWDAVVALFALATAKISFIKRFGIGTGLAIVIDAPVVRGIMVLAILRLMGDRSWWSPRALRKLYNKFGLSEGEPGQPGPQQEPAKEATPTN
ncbi:MMPL family transporter [Actinopolyspora saharensis]|uniref:MMPL family transporter n=1 Tax=Actinopolyspora saharensis TaxID=995062 RepID=UPI000B8A295A|nr:MMPL family transporter [Actinopolyspora saharensis]